MRQPEGRVVDIHSQLRILRARDRNGIMGIGPEGYADITGPVRVNFHQTSTAQPMRPPEQVDVQASHMPERMPFTPLNGKPKRQLSRPAVDGRDAKRARTVGWVDEGGDADFPSAAGAGFVSRAVTQPFSKLEQSKASACEVDKGDNNSERSKTYEITNLKVNGDEVQLLDSRTGTPASKRRALLELDTDAVQIIEAKSVIPAAKHEASVTPSSRSTKEPAKTIIVLESDDEVETNNANSSAAKKKDAPNKSQATLKTSRNQIDGSDEYISFSKEIVGKEDEEEQEGPEAAKKHAQAEKELGRACRTCKTRASQSMKTMYETQISMLKKEHREALRTAKANVAQKSKTEKTKLKQDIDDLKTKHSKEVTDLKKNHSGKMTELKQKHEKVLTEGEERYRNMSQKLTESTIKLTKERDEANIKRRESEKDAQSRINDMTCDTNAAKKELKEQKRQLMRETREQVEQLKPEHSTIVKQKDRMISDLADQVAIMEGRLARAEHDLRIAEATVRENQKQLEDGKASVERSNNQVQLAEDNLREFDQYLKNMEGRDAGNIARLEEQLDIVKGNLQEQTNRVVNLQRENRVANEALAVRAQRCRESDAKVERLRKVLGEAQAQVGVTTHLDKMV